MGVERPDVGPRARLLGREIQRLVGRKLRWQASARRSGRRATRQAPGRWNHTSTRTRRSSSSTCRTLVCASGPRPADLSETVALGLPLALHIPELDRRVFEWTRAGYADVMVIYDQVDDIRWTSAGRPAGRRRPSPVGKEPLTWPLRWPRPSA